MPLIAYVRLVLCDGVQNIRFAALLGGTILEIEHDSVLLARSPTAYSQRQIQYLGGDKGRGEVHYEGRDGVAAVGLFIDTAHLVCAIWWC